MGLLRDGAAPVTTPPRTVHEAVLVLARTVGGALAALSDLRDPPAVLLDGRTEAALRHALSLQPAIPSDPQSASAVGAAAVRSACAHLSVRAWTDAYLALLTAKDHLGTGRQPACCPSASMLLDGLGSQDVGVALGSWLVTSRHSPPVSAVSRALATGRACLRAWAAVTCCPAARPAPATRA